MKLTNREIDLIIIFCLLQFALLVSIALIVVNLYLYEDGSILIKGCLLPFMGCN